MQLKAVVGILSAVMLCLLSTTVLIKSNNGKTTIQAQEPVNKPKIKATQLFPETGTGTLPVELELIPEEAQAQDLTNANASRGDSSPKIHFRIKNNSAKTITAYQVHIHADTGIEGSKPVVEYVKDFAPHPDIREYEQIQPLLPGASVTYGPRGVKLEDKPNEKIQTLRLNLDFVVYEDGTFVSSVKNGAEAVLSMRRGAEIFKQLAVKVYNENSQSADKLFKWLSEIKPYQDMVFEGEHDIQGYQITGANAYRNFLSRLYHVDRIALNKYLTEVK
ncbi:MAG: hypothetical protein ACREEM_03570 [Blastocatellia bacterium]